ncbi:hypothetical protein HC124_04505 [Winkia neuii]|uniref:hypothetical protein n=1 Tax=Winkia TaxID=2692118 RepID=UPI00142F543D|nr:MULTISPECIES: hypothetical protein [Winkia]MDK7185915.1 hypothetical protein [Winkia sp. UMB1295B]NJJ15486.1 hypothetical protein [Winkia neuii]
MPRIPAYQLGIDLADLVHDLHVFAFDRRDEELWVEVANKRQLSKTTQGYAWLLEEVADEAKLARRDLSHGSQELTESIPEDDELEFQAVTLLENALASDMSGLQRTLEDVDIEDVDEVAEVVGELSGRLLQMQLEPAALHEALVQVGQRYDVDFADLDTQVEDEDDDEEIDDIQIEDEEEEW